MDVFINPYHWTPVYGAWTINNNKAISASDSLPSASYNLVTYANYNVTMKMVLPNNTTALLCGIIFRYAATNNFYFAALSSNGTTAFIQLYHYTNAWYDMTLLNSVSVAEIRNAVTTLQVISNGSSIKIYYEGILVLDITDSTNNDKTTVGMQKMLYNGMYDVPIDEFYVYDIV